MNLIDIRAKRGPNPGGLVNVYIIPFNHLIGFLVDPDGVIRQDIQLKEGTRFFVYEFDPGKARVRSASSGTEGGKFFQPGVELSIAGDEGEKLQMFGKMINGLFIVIVEQPSGRRKLAGSSLCPALCTQADYDGGGDTDNFNGTIFQFQTRGEMIRDYEGLIPLDPVAAPPPPLEVQLTKTDVTINGGNDGTINSSVTGGEAPYTYLWNDGATTANRTGLVAGTYELTVTDSFGTQTTASITINEPSNRATAWRAKESTAYCVTE